MARLLEVTETKYNGKAHGTAISKAYGVKYINNFTEYGSPAVRVVEINSRDEQDLREVSDSYADLKTNFNTADTVVGAQSIELSVKKIIGMSELTTARLTSFPTENIVEVTPDPDDATDSIVIVRDDNRLTDVRYVVDETVSAIAALANI